MACSVRLVPILLLCAPIAGCAFLQALSGGGSTPPALRPQQVLLVASQSAPITTGVRVSVFALPHDFQNYGIDHYTVEGEGGLLSSQYARPFTTPGIAANSDV